MVKKPIGREKYIQDMLDFVSSIVFKNDTLGKYIEIGDSPDFYRSDISADRRDWKYYKNLTGNYHENDKGIYIKLVETDELTLLSKEIVNKHMLTKAELLKGKSGLYSNIFIPDNLMIIKGMLSSNGLTTNELIELDDITIIDYDKSLLESNEKYIIKELEEYAKKVSNAHLNKEFAFYEKNYLPLFISNLYNGLFLKIYNLRISKINTIYSHSYFVDLKFKSTKELNNDVLYLSNYSKQWLYMNVDYLNKNIGNKVVFNAVVDNVVKNSGYKLSILSIEKEQTTDKNPSEFFNYVIKAKNITGSGESDIEPNQFAYMLSEEKSQHIMYSSRDRILRDMNKLVRETRAMSIKTKYMLLEKDMAQSTIQTMLSNKHYAIEYILWLLLNNKLSFGFNVLYSETKESFFISNGEELVALLLLTLNKSGRVIDLSKVTGVSTNSILHAEGAEINDFMNSLTPEINSLISPLVSNIPVIRNIGNVSELRNKISEIDAFIITIDNYMYNENSMVIKEALFTFRNMLFKQKEIPFFNYRTGKDLVTSYDISNKYVRNATNFDMLLNDIIVAVTGLSFNNNEDAEEATRMKSILDKMTTYLTKTIINKGVNIINIPVTKSVMLEGNEEAKIIKATTTLSLPTAQFVMKTEVITEISPESVSVSNGTVRLPADVMLADVGISIGQYNNMSYVSINGGTGDSYYANAKVVNDIEISGGRREIYDVEDNTETARIIIVNDTYISPLVSCGYGINTDSVISTNRYVLETTQTIVFENCNVYNPSNDGIEILNTEVSSEAYYVFNSVPFMPNYGTAETEIKLIPIYEYGDSLVTTSTDYIVGNEDQIITCTVGNYVIQNQPVGVGLIPMNYEIDDITKYFDIVNTSSSRTNVVGSGMMINFAGGYLTESVFIGIENEVELNHESATFDTATPVSLILNDSIVSDKEIGIYVLDNYYYLKNNYVLNNRLDKLWITNKLEDHNGVFDFNIDKILYDISGLIGIGFTTLRTGFVSVVEREEELVVGSSVIETPVTSVDGNTYINNREMDINIIPLTDKAYAVNDNGILVTDKIARSIISTANDTESTIDIYKDVKVLELTIEIGEPMPFNVGTVSSR